MKKSIFISLVLLTSLAFSAYGILRSQEQPAEAETSETPAFDDYNRAGSLRMIRASYTFLRGCSAVPAPANDLVYKVGHRFYWAVTPSRIAEAKTIWDILPEDAFRRYSSYEKSVVSPVSHDPETHEVIYHQADESIEGESNALNPDQVEFLRAAPINSNLYIRADQALVADKAFPNDYMQYFFTVIPEQEAAYKSGEESLIQYLRGATQSQTAHLTSREVKPCKINFTVTADGKVEDVSLDYTSGYPEIDTLLLDVVRHIPGEWTPATNAAGVAVDQQFVFFFGNEGC